ncbi:hypothetical protein N0V90_007186 [Kalmusia sp. IMI 367209]|nr:hypothetical protein N0V90_007186 [Kalmusia sp. IMI 367209]
MRPRRHRPGVAPYAQQQTASPEARTMLDRAEIGGHFLRSKVSAGMSRLFGWRWWHLKARISNFFYEHRSVESAVLCIVGPPMVVVFFTLAAFIWAFEICERRRRWFLEWIDGLLYEPPRELLDPEEEGRRIAARKERDRMKALPLVRPRSLTLRSGDAFREDVGAHDGRRVRQKTVDQLGACELWRFPFEVRELIWKNVIGGNHIHIMKKRGRLGSVYCPAKDPKDPAHRDFCIRRDEKGFYMPTAWPMDMRPLALLLTCRQIYSECIDFLYSLNTFAFDDPALLDLFLNSLLPQRSRLISQFHFTPVFGREGSDLGHDRLVRLNEPSVSQTINHLGYALNRLAQQPTLHSLSITPKLLRDFKATGDGFLRRFVWQFTRSLNKMHASTPITLAWPEDPAMWTPAQPTLVGYWGRDENLPREEERNFELRSIPWQSPTVLMTFFVPFDVQCFHCNPYTTFDRPTHLNCRNYTIIRRTTKGFAEVSFLSTDFSPSPPSPGTTTRVITRYWTFHTFCGGWIEFQYHETKKEWSVTQGGQRISKDEADRHVAQEGEGMYPHMENGHERLQGVSVRDLVADLVPRGRAEVWFDRTGFIDGPVRDAYYRNLEWNRGGRGHTG